MTLQAATDGLGLAVGPLPVLAGDVASGRFATPFPEIKAPRPSHFLLVPADADKTRRCGRSRGRSWRRAARRT